jgi:ABC-type polysaccharide/polyol phosphate transport system ATPase subunit
MWNAVEAEGLTKVYRVYASPWDRLREALFRRPRHREFRALESVSFAIPRGEGLAIVGENGAGKSTLLKILAGITTPSAGGFRVDGKIASILELGSGFHPDFTGRQNIVLNAAMLGLDEDELRRKMPDILGFSELGDFIDQPVKTYSTGMAMRLGFSIATQVEPDVLIIDEALSVGDGYFQKKCMDRLLQFVEGGGTLLFCSHAMYYVSSFCQRALWLRNGRAEALGPAEEVIREYENFLVAKSAAALPEEGAEEKAPRGPARIASARLVNGPRYENGEPWEVEVEWETEEPGLAFHVGVGINRSDEIEVCSFATHVDGLPPLTGERRYTVRLRIPRLPLVKGEFTLYVFLLDGPGLHIYDQRRLPRAFTVHSPSYAFGLIRADHDWEVEPRQLKSVSSR